MPRADSKTDFQIAMDTMHAFNKAYNFLLGKAQLHSPVVGVEPVKNIVCIYNAERKGCRLGVLQNKRISLLHCAKLVTAETMTEELLNLTKFELERRFNAVYPATDYDIAARKEASFDIPKTGTAEDKMKALMTAYSKAEKKMK